MVKCNNVSFRYSASSGYILQNINLDITENGLYFVMGKSGCGKSTFLNLLSKYLTCSNGTIKIKGKVGHYFQDYKLFDFMTCYDNLEFVLSCSNSTNKKNLIDSYLEKYSLLGKKDQLVSTLSGGEKARICLIRLLLMESNVLLIDEATGELDSENSDFLLSEIKKISKDKIIIFVTHNDEIANKYGDKIYLLEDKKLSLLKDNISKKEESEPILLSSNDKSGSISLSKSLKFNYQLYKSKKLRIIFSSLILAFAFTLLALVCNLLFSFNKVESRMFETGINNNIATINKIETVSNANGVSLNRKNRLSDKEKEEILKLDQNAQFLIDLTYFFPSSYSLTIKDKSCDVLLIPTYGTSLGGYVSFNKSVYNTFGDILYDSELLIDKKINLKLNDEDYVYENNISFEFTSLIEDNSFSKMPKIYYDYSYVYDEVLNTSLKGEFTVSDFLANKEDLDTKYFNYGDIIISSNLMHLQNNETFFTVNSSLLDEIENFSTIIKSGSKLVIIFLAILILICVLLELLVITTVYNENKESYAILLSFNFNKKTNESIVGSISVIFFIMIAALFCFLYLPSFFFVNNFLLAKLGFGVLMHSFRIDVFLMALGIIFCLSVIPYIYIRDSIKKDDLLLTLRREA